MKRDLLSVSDLSSSEIDSIYKEAAKIKERRKNDISYTPLQGKTMAMIFHKVSTRTRVSFQSGLFQMGGLAIDLVANNLQMSRGETLADTARTLSRYVDALLIRTYKHDLLEEIATYATIPVINGLTDQFHPIQILSDLFTIREKKGTLDDLKVAYIGDGNNIAHSWLNMCAVKGFNLTVSCPKGFEPNTSILEQTTLDVAEKGGKIIFLYDPREAVENADIIYTDVWVSIGQEKEKGSKKEYFKEYQVNRELLALAKRNALVMHCLPAHRGEEITAEVLDGDQSIVFEQAENRLYVQNAIMKMLILGEL
ncbi:MAG: ornithine carbamoyltransferase [bacterium]